MSSRVDATTQGEATSLDTEVGPFHDASGVMALLGAASEEEVDARRAAGTILGVRSADGVWAYPVFQFTAGDVDERLVPLIQALGGRPAWSAALWLVTPIDELEGSTPLEWVRGDRLPQAVLASAQRVARAWS